MIRSCMRHRATVERDTNVANDYGDEGAPDWQMHLESQPCFAWNRNTSSAGDERYGEEAVTSDYYPVMVVPLRTDIKETDRVSVIKDRLGNELFGTMDIKAVLRRADHLEVRMKYHA